MARRTQRELKTENKCYLFYLTKETNELLKEISESCNTSRSYVISQVIAEYGRAWATQNDKQERSNA